MNFAKLHGLNSVDNIIGSTTSDLYDILKWDFGPDFIHWQKNKIKEIKEAEYKVVNLKRRIIVEKSLLFTSEGFITIQEMIKQPIFSKDKKEVVSIYTYNYDVTFQRSLFELFNLYQKYYIAYGLERAIQKFISHLNIDGYFTELPTVEEIQALLEIHQDIDMSNEIENSTFLLLRDKVDANCRDEMLARLRAIPINIH